MSTNPLSSEDIRAYLGALAQSRLRCELIGKVDLSGVIQETLLDAHTAAKKYPAGDQEQERAWLTTVFERNLTDTVRCETAQCRDKRREVPLDVPAGLPALGLAADELTPRTTLLERESSGIVAQALAQLKPEQRTAVELRYLKGQSLATIATALGKSKPAVAGLLCRGLEALRQQLAEVDPSEYPRESRHEPRAK